MAKTNFEILEKDFNAFERGIDRLDFLKKELNSLNTKGFEKDKNKIESELTNVTDIPKIERQLKTLKQKINGNYNPKPLKPKKKNIVKRTLSKRKIKVDQGVDELVKLKFDQIASDLKRSISERVKNPYS